MRTQFILIALASAFASPTIAQKNNGNGGQGNATPSPTGTTPSLPDANQASSTSSSSSKTDSPPVPSITSDTGGPPGLPPIPTTSAAGAFSYPPATVPPTQNAPFMQRSNLPDGTVFIAVGAILGAFAVAILVWRAVVACLLHRSVKRATLAQQVANDKKSYPPPAAPFYKYTDHASSVSVANPPPPRGARKPRGPVPSSTPSQSNLFFSPTAPVGASSSGNRESRFLPSGFYASGSATPQQGQGQSISMTNLRPDSYAHARSFEHSPPESPALPPPHEVGRRNPSSSTVNLNGPPTGRAPSAFLEDLLGDQSEQSPPPGHRNTWQQSPGRF